MWPQKAAQKISPGPLGHITETLVEQTAVPARRHEPLTITGSAGPSLLESLVPGAKVWHKVAAVVIGIIVVSLLAQARFYLPDNPVPITLQGFGVLMVGGMLGWRLWRQRAGCGVSRTTGGSRSSSAGHITN